MNIEIRNHVELVVIGGSVGGVETALKEKLAGTEVFVATPYSYFGDDLCSTLNLRKVPAFLRENGLDNMPTPMSVKRLLDRLMIRAGIPFLFQTFALGFVDDCVILANRDGIFAVQTNAVLDVTPYYTLARKSGMPFTPFTPGPQQALCRALASCERTSADWICHDRPCRLIETETAVELNDLNADSLFHAELEARNKTWKPEFTFVADRVTFPRLPHPIGPDPKHFVFTPESWTGFRKHASLPLKRTIEYTPSEIFKCDIAVAGGGTAGASAAIPGAKKGLRMLVMERLSHLGGIGTQGRIAAYWFGLKIGRTKELDDKVQACSPEPVPGNNWKVEHKQYVLERDNFESGVSVWLDTFCCYAVKNGERIESLWAATPFGGVLVTAQQFIDCTGNAELAFLCGAPTQFSAEDEPAYQGSGMSPVVPGCDVLNTDYMFTVDSGAKDVMRAFITGRDRCQAYFDLAQIPGTRERRRIVGEIVLRASDFYAHRTYPDVISLASSNFDTHGFTVDPLLMFHPTDEEPYIAEIPFRALLSPGISNLMTTGLGVSAQRDAIPLIRMIADVQNQGFAAGLIAAEAVAEGKVLREIDLTKVQSVLKNAGFLSCEEQKLASDLNQDAAVFISPDIPALENEFRAAPDFEKALRLAFLGSSVGLDLLKQTVRDHSWDDGWDYRGMGQFGKSVSRFDAAIIAMIPLTEDCSFLLPRLQEMKKETQFSHFRAVSRFLMKHPCAKAVPELERLLGCFECHAVADWTHLIDSSVSDFCDVEERNLQLRELYLAGALHACAPGNPRAKDFLEKYKNGVHKLYAIYAEKWLKVR